MKSGRVFLGGLVVLIMAALAAFHYSKSRTSQLFGELVARVETREPLIALTFDDGPTSRFTPEILEVLEARGVRATFFLIGQEIEANLDAARSIIAAGHEVGNHSYSHPRMVLMGLDSVANEIERTDAALRKAGFEGEILFRPPYGKKLFSLPWYLSQHRRKTVMWDVEPESFPQIEGNGDANAIVERVLREASAGSIILLHPMYESRASTRAALPYIIDGLHARGFRFVTVSELLAIR